MKIKHTPFLLMVSSLAIVQLLKCRSVDSFSSQPHARQQTLEGEESLSEQLPDISEQSTDSSEEVPIVHYAKECFVASTGEVCPVGILKLQNRFLEIRFANEPKLMVEQAEILDLLDLLQLEFPENPSLASLVFDPIEQSRFQSSLFEHKQTIPLIDYYQLNSASKNIGEYISANGIETLGKKKFRELTLGALFGEYTGYAKLIDLVTKTGFNPIGLFRANSIQRTVTRTQGNKHKKFKKSNGPIEIAKFSANVGITLYETIPEKRAGVWRRVYRGPKYLFGRSLREYVSINDWFVRDLTNQARQSYLGPSIEEELSLGGDASDGNYIISVADARVRIHELKPEKLGVLQHLADKIVSAKALKEAEASLHDNPYNYRRKHAFTLKELLGHGNDPAEQMGMRQIDFVVGQNYNKFNDIQLHQAQHELLSAIYRDFSRVGVLEVIHRLAPADVHNYVAPVNGKPLSQFEIAQFLLKRATAYKSYYKAKKDTRRFDFVEKEIKHLTMLKMFFFQFEQQLGRPTSSTLNIHGSNLSVAATAIKNRSNILAQNDRKIMLFRHGSKDSLIASLQVFIGAAGVNRVAVEPTVHQRKLGERLGDMQFGTDSYLEDPPYAQANDKSTLDGYLKIKVGENLGSFTPGGSTIISLYPAAHFVAIDPIVEYFDHGSYTDSKADSGYTQVEVKVQMGNNLLLRKEQYIIQALRSAGFTPKSTPSVRKALSGYTTKVLNSIQSLKVIKNQLPLMSHGNLSIDEALVVKNLKKSWK